MAKSPPENILMRHLFCHIAKLSIPKTQLCTWTRHSYKVKEEEKKKNSETVANKNRARIVPAIWQASSLIIMMSC